MFSGGEINMGGELWVTNEGAWKQNGGHGEKIEHLKKKKFLHCYSYKYIVTYTKQFYDFNEKNNICCNLEDLLIN